MSLIRIHVVDDDRDAVDLLRSYLSHADCTLTSSFSGEDALRHLAATSPPDVLLLDVQMAGLDGFETLAALRAIPGLRDLPVIFLSSFDRPNLKVRALEMGADDYVTKPYHPAELLARARAVMRRRHGEPLAAGRLEGNLARFPVATLLQSLAVAGRDASVRFPERRGEQRTSIQLPDPSLAKLGVWAWISLAKGRFVDACFGSLRGASALARLLLCNSGQFETRFDDAIEPLPNGPGLPIDGLLLRLLVEIDEAREVIAAVARLDEPLRLGPCPSAEVASWFAMTEVTPEQILIRSTRPFADTTALLVAAHRRGEILSVETPQR